MKLILNDKIIFFLKKISSFKGINILQRESG